MNYNFKLQSSRFFKGLAQPSRAIPNGREALEESVLSGRSQNLFRGARGGTTRQTEISSPKQLN